MRIGIQGDIGSASEEAAIRFCNQIGIDNPEFIYLIKAERVIEALKSNHVNYGVLVDQSPLGVPVEETLRALEHNLSADFKIAASLECLVPNAILTKRYLEATDYRRIFSHSVPLRKHEEYLNKHFPNCTLEACEDTGIAARRLANGEYDEDSLVLAMPSAAEKYGLKILIESLPANQGYLTRFHLYAATGLAE